MDKEHLKKRIVGAIVLVALGVIFIPMILSGDNDTAGIWGSNVPDKPKPLQALADKPMPTMPPHPAIGSTVTATAESKPVDIPSESALPTPVATVVPPSVPVTNSEPTPTPATVKVEVVKPAIERAWIVQLGSFAQQANAISLRDKLIKKKYAAFVDSVKQGQGTAYRVRVGPHVRRADADAQAIKLAKEFKLKGVVLPHP